MSNSPAFALYGTKFQGEPFTAFRRWKMIVSAL
jgi:hypothetical protein